MSTLEKGSARTRPEGISRLRSWPHRILQREESAFFLFITPWILGFAVFTLGPFVASMWLSLNKWSIAEPAEFVGIDNYRKMLIDDETWRRAIWNTIYYTTVAVPLQQVVALALALLLNQQLRGIYIYRTIFYLPAVTSGVATAMLWVQVFGYHTGAFNAVLSWFGLQPQAWLSDLKLAMPTLIFISAWSVGRIFMIYLAGLQSVSKHLYEAAEVDGAGAWDRFANITIPMISPSIFFNIVMGLIGSFQVFTQAYVMTGGGPANRTLFYVLYLYLQAFIYFSMGYASAMAWVLFVIILGLTAVQLYLSRKWVYYEAGDAGRGFI